jgi:hypothetical protein
MFLPVSIGGGLLAGVIGKKLFGLIWGAIDDQEPPQPEHRGIHPGKLALALAIEGALFSVVKGLVDHGSRHAFTRLTGSWPGDEAPDKD